MIFSPSMFDKDAAVAMRLKRFMDGVGELLGNDARRASFATYVNGLLSEGERKSVEPLAARACPSPEKADAAHQRLLHFIAVAEWCDADVRSFAAKFALGPMTSREPVTSWILDDTGFLKQGKHSVGVQRQYTGSAGKVTNCQVGVSLTVATESEHLPIDFELYLPESWTNDAEKRAEARIPETVTFKTKLQLGLQMVRRALTDGIPRGVILADAAYGTSSDFRAELQGMGLQYSLGVEGNTTVFEVGNPVTRGGQSVSLRVLAKKLMAKGRFQRCTWREGTKADLSASFAMVRVAPCKATRSRKLPQPQTVWLLIEWRDDEDEPSNYFFSNLPETTSLLELVRITMQRWRVERSYEDLKGELGLDHYEGRRFPGWHHHISVTLCCYAFLVSERVQRFSPSAAGTLADQAHGVAA